MRMRSRAKGTLKTKPFDHRIIVSSAVENGAVREAAT